MTARQKLDDLAWDRSDELWDMALKHVCLSSTCRKIESFIETIYEKPATLNTPLIIGGFNVLYPVKVQGVSDNLLIRLPCPDQAVFPEEKLLAEAATASYLRQHTQLPIPEVFHYGISSEIGPFIIMQDLGSRRDMDDALQRHREDTNESPVLNPDISESKLSRLYSQMARCVLQLVQPTFPLIGALIETSPMSYCITERPTTLNMNNMVRLCNIPESILPAKRTTYHTADEWYCVLAEMQIATLLFQHNDIVSSEDDCRNKYVARQLFRRLAKQGRLTKFGFLEDDWSVQSMHSRATLPAPDNAGCFRLWSDDFRPVNIVVDEDDQLIGAIDWEFAYAAPTHFALDPPWWLLLEVPEMWEEGIEDWTLVYEKRLTTWLLAIEEAEREMSPGSFLLSRYMRESWSTGRFWLNYAARKSWAFDTIYWKYLDKRFFGTRETTISMDERWKTRVHLLSEEERVAMEPFVRMKMEEARERTLVEWDDNEARQRLGSILFD